MYCICTHSTDTTMHTYMLILSCDTIISAVPSLSKVVLVDETWVQSGICPVKWQRRDSKSEYPTTKSVARALATAPLRPFKPVVSSQTRMCRSVSGPISCLYTASRVGLYYRLIHTGCKIYIQNQLQSAGYRPQNY